MLVGVMVAGITAPLTIVSPARAGTLTQTKSQLTPMVRGLPGSTSVLIREPATMTVLATRQPTTRRVPASVTKLFTTSTALITDGPATRLTTELRIDGTIDDDGVLSGDLIVRGAGDPAFSLAGVSTLAAAAKKAGIVRISGTLRADLGPWTADQGTPLTGGAYNGEIGGRLGALVVSRGFASATVADPARQVLVALRDALRAGGLVGPVAFGSPAASGAGTTVIGSVSSPTIAQLVAATNAPSDNFYAEELLRGVGARHGAAGTTTAGLAVERATLASVGVRPSLADGSGLSRGNRAAPSTIVRLLDVMASRPEGGALRASLALAGSTGTLAARMRGTAAAGRCRAKTGTLSNVSALAGWCTTVGGRTVSFAIVMNGVSVPAARRRQDAILAVLAGWSDPLNGATIPSATAPATTPTTSATPAPTTPSTPSGGASPVAPPR
jgi:D-alanyl-D-alanine carboxypeptidase/D-alanyl-D-alanine-endopeptidase (penicillin-binding protein 4)